MTTAEANHPAPVILDDAALAEIEARERRAMSAPWRRHRTVVEHGAMGGKYLCDLQRVADAEFIAHARTDIPALCQTVRALREQLAESDAIIKSYNDAEWKTNTALREQLAEVQSAERRATIGLSNIYHIVTNQRCDDAVALGMATSAVGSLVQQLAFEKKWHGDHEEREAAVCPEDVPCDEYIRHLESRLAQVEKERDHYKRLYEL